MEGEGRTREGRGGEGRGGDGGEGREESGRSTCLPPRFDNPATGLAVYLTNTQLLSPSPTTTTLEQSDMSVIS